MREFITAILPSEFILFHFSPTVLPTVLPAYIYSRAFLKVSFYLVAYLVLASHWCSLSIVGFLGSWDWMGMVCIAYASCARSLA